jgi:L-threonylcarbamoyladenylate synthase
MRVLQVDPERPEPGPIREAADIIRGGGLVAFPTETVYGLGGNALDSEAIERIFAAKGRPAYNPLIAHAADPADARALSSSWSDAAERLATAFWPGPLTLVVPRREDIPARLTAGLPTVAVRVPSHPVAYALLREAGLPIAAPSANRFTELSPTRAGHVVKGLADRIDLLLDAGPAQLGIESTVVDVSGKEPVLLRPGTLSRADLERALGQPLASAADVSGSDPRPGPGMIEKHYAPRARLVVIPTGSDLESAVSSELSKGRKVGVLLFVEDGPSAIEGLVGRDGAVDLEIVRMPADAEGYARDLYTALHALDDSGRDVILAVEVPEGGAWTGVRDRLRRASHTA